ncbi:hypothetical protein JOF41_005768 [Saccharothrix coeruleofusca]|uniref:hypothetical protein n=1 Tax=Saccharothrix coeruleofusca TaxID=33919 RepID=UPI001AE9DA8E|nr:hypothetical protein [Saccharothrix coeruleofusca]MBP2339590.1 hypothetical protein [Saccharothrix coeruleofusca]
MAISNAVRRTGSLLLRAAAVGGFAGAAWLLGSGVAAAVSDDPADEVRAALDAVRQAAHQEQAAHQDELIAALLDQRLPGPPRLAVLEVVPTEQVVPVEHPADPAEPEWEPVAAGFHSVGLHSGNLQVSGRTGAVSNTVPPEVYQAKVAARAEAALALAPPVPEATAPVPPPPPAHAPPAAPVRTAPAEPAPAAPVAPAVPAVPDTPATPDLTWENPEPGAPSPASQHAPAAPSAPIASSSTHDSSNGHRGGGTVALLTAQSALQPATAWSVERRDDWRSPGSVPGLPSTSPD